MKRHGWALAASVVALTIALGSCQNPQALPAIAEAQQLQAELAGRSLTANWGAARFRGTPNNWGTTAMSLVANNTWETTQDFTGQTNPRFKIDRFGNWAEAHPAQDFLIPSPGRYRIQFNDSTRAITIALVTTGWIEAYFRGTPNNWGVTAMNKTGNNTWETIQNFTGQTNPRFRIDRHGNWAEAFPAGDFLISPAGQYRIVFNDSTRAITVTRLTTTEWTNAFFRGTPNNWGTTAMSRVGPNLWQTTQDFSGQVNPRFKIDRHGDWTENFPAQDFLITVTGRYTITFNDSTRSITVALDTPATVAAPVIRPESGVVFTTTDITMSTITPGASIFYTIDGTTPTATSTRYTAPFRLASGTQTVRAIATLTGATNSPVTTNTYTVTAPNGGITVHVRGFTHIHYWNVVPAGVMPTVTWPGAALVADHTGWMRFTLTGATSAGIVFSNAGGGQTPDLNRTAGTWWYHGGAWHSADPIGPAVPVISAGPNPGRYTTAQNVVLTSSNPDDVIFFTRDGSTPTQTSTRYTGAISVTALDTIKAMGVNRNGVVGAVVTLTYDINANHDLTPPTITPQTNPGVFPAAITVRFTVADNGAGVQAWYTTQNRAATTADIAYTSGAQISIGATTTLNFLVRDAAGNLATASFRYTIGAQPRGDFREETIYFLMTTRFFDGDPANNVWAWDDARAGNVARNDPAWRGDFRGLIQKLDYIKALGFSAIWITPVVKNMSGYDYHGYHAVDHTEVDPRLLSPGVTYQTLINEVHARGMRLIQDVVLNHTGNFGEENLHPLFEADASGNYLNWQNPAAHRANALLEAGARAVGGAGATYAGLTDANKFQARIRALRAPLDTRVIYNNHDFKGGWERSEVQYGSIAGDCQDLNTENPIVSAYLRDAYKRFIAMGVDAFRIDTVKHINRLTFNREFIPQFRAAGGPNFFMFGEVCTRYRNVWNSGIAAISTPFYTWNATSARTDASYPWGDHLTNKASKRAHWNDNSTLANQPSSNNHLLINNTYRTPDWSRRSFQDVIDFPMHWAFGTAHDAWNMAVGSDHTYNDATFNVTYVDSHDYAPDHAPENRRFMGVWPGKLSLIFTFRGIPTIYYGTEIEFMKGAIIDVGPNMPLADTGRAYFGNHIRGTVNVTDFGRFNNATGAKATTLAHPLATHIRALNLIRRAVPALQRGQYAVDGFQAFRRRFTDANVDSFALVVLDGTRTFHGVPNGTYRCVVTGQLHTVSNGSATLSAPGVGNLRVWVLTGGPRQNDPGHVLAGMFPLAHIR